MRRSVFTRIGFAVLAIGFAECWAGDLRSLLANPRQKATTTEAKPIAGEVKIDNFSFGPPSMTVAAGTTVTWINRDDIPHTVVSADGIFKSRAIDTDEKFSFTFAKPGTYSYFCSLHPKMTGTVVVR